MNKRVLDITVVIFVAVVEVFIEPDLSQSPRCASFQINMLLNFKDEKQECPCPEYIREQLLDFHEDLMRHCGKRPLWFTCTARPTFK